MYDIGCGADGGSPAATNPTTPPGPVQCVSHGWHVVSVNVTNAPLQWIHLIFPFLTAISHL